MSGPDPPYKLALIGGGIGGLCLAIGLVHNNVPFHLYEAAAAFAEIGAGVSFNAAAQRAMRLIDPRIAEGFFRQATHNATLTQHWFQYRYGQDRRGPGPDGQPRVAGDLFAELKGPEYGQCATHRAHFLDELIRLMPQEQVSFGHKVVRVDDRGDYVELQFENGVSTRASGVIGCDGIKSHVRDGLLGPEYRAQFTGKYAYRGLLDMDRSAELLGDTVARNSQMHIGYHGHVLTFPVEHGKTMNIVAFRTQDGPWTDERWVVPMDRKDMEADFADWGANVQKILSLMEKPDVWALFDHPPAPTFFKNRVVLMGDAAHACKFIPPLFRVFMDLSTSDTASRLWCWIRHRRCVRARQRAWGCDDVGRAPGRICRVRCGSQAQGPEACNHEPRHWTSLGIRG